MDPERHRVVEPLGLVPAIQPQRPDPLVLHPQLDVRVCGVEFVRVHACVRARGFGMPLLHCVFFPSVVLTVSSAGYASVFYAFLLLLAHLPPALCPLCFRNSL